MKKIFNLIKFVIIVVILIAIISAVKPMFVKTPLTVETFTEYFDDVWTVTDAREYAALAEDSKLEVLDNIYVAANNENYCEIWFYDFMDVVSAETMYDESLELINDFISNSSTQSTSAINGSNYTKYIASNGSQTWIVVQLEDTVLYAEVANSQADSIKEVFKGLGY